MAKDQRENLSWDIGCSGGRQTFIPVAVLKQTGFFYCRVLAAIVLLLMCFGAKPVHGASPKNFLYKEAGIAVYFSFEGPTNLESNLLRNAFRTIQTANAEYLIGAVTAPGYESDVQQDAKVFIHNSGWVVIYYLKDEPCSKILDVEYEVKTRLEKIAEKVIEVLDAQVGTLQYTHFQYPNAQRILRVGRLRPNQAGTNTFEIRLPGSNTFYEHAWFIKAASSMNTATFHLDGKAVGSTKWFNFGVIQPGDMVMNAKHIIGIQNQLSYWGLVFGEMVLIYSGEGNFVINYADWIYNTPLTHIPEGLDAAASDVAVYYDHFLPTITR